MIVANEVLNEMDTDELRNYTVKLHEEMHTLRELCFARHELVEIMQRAYDAKCHEEDCLSRMNAACGRTTEVVRELEEKYEYATPRWRNTLKEINNQKETESN